MANNGQRGKVQQMTQFWSARGGWREKNAVKFTAVSLKTWNGLYAQFSSQWLLQHLVPCKFKQKIKPWASATWQDNTIMVQSTFTQILVKKNRVSIQSTLLLASTDYKRRTWFSHFPNNVAILCEILLGNKNEKLLIIHNITLTDLKKSEKWAWSHK